MSKIITVTGPIAPEMLGVTTMHDHVLAYLTPFFKSQLSRDAASECPIDTEQPITIENLSYMNEFGLRSYCADNWDLSSVSLMKKEVDWFKQRGGSSILEASAPGIRNNITGTRKIAQETGVNIIASTGLYVACSWPEKFRKMTQKEYHQYLLKEIEVGIDDSDILAGHIKTAIRDNNPEELKFIATSAEVAGKKNMLLTAHTSRGTAPESRRKMLQLLLDSGISPEKLLLCHIHFTFWQGSFIDAFINPDKYQLQLDWAKEVMDMGVNVCIDCFGEQPGSWNSVRIAGLISLLNAGYEDQIVIGNDIYQKTMTKAYGGFGYCGIIDYVIPELLQHGITKITINKIMVENPAKMLQL